MHQQNPRRCMPAANCTTWSCLVCADPYVLNRHGELASSKAIVHLAWWLTPVEVHVSCVCEL